MINELKKNWQNNLLHLTIQLCVSWVFVIFIRKALEDYFHIEISYFCVVVIACSIFVMLYFAVYFPLDSKVDCEWFIIGILASVFNVVFPRLTMFAYLPLLEDYLGRSAVDINHNAFLIFNVLPIFTYISGFMSNKIFNIFAYFSVVFAIVSFLLLLCGLSVI